MTKNQKGKMGRTKQISKWKYLDAKRKLSVLDAQNWKYLLRIQTLAIVGTSGMTQEVFFIPLTVLG